MIVDCHTHVFEPDVAAKRETLARTCRYFGLLYADPRRRLSGAPELLASMKRAGVHRSVSFGFPWADAGRRRAANDYVVEAAETSGGRIIPFAVVDPNDPRDAEAELARLVPRGLRGIGELVPDGQGFRLDDAKTLTHIMDMANAYHLVVTVHASEPVGHDYPGKGTATPDALVRFAAAFPENTIVASHWGGGAIFYEMMSEVAETLRNVWYDSAASSYLYDNRVFMIGAAIAPKKVLLGTDFPLLSQRAFLKGLHPFLADTHELPDFLGNNASRLFGD